jgi:hypothetical protein
MKPRLPQSKKWTALPKEYISQIEDVFQQGFATQLTKSKLIIEGRVYSEEITLRVGLLENGTIRQRNFEVSITYSPKKKDAVERIYNAIDAAASMMNEYFDDPEADDFPRAWKEYDFDQQKVFLQYSTVNTELESQADALLGETAEDLVIEEPVSEDALEVADEVILSASEEDIDPEDEDEEDLPQEKGPSMFSGKKKKKDDLH